MPRVSPTEYPHPRYDRGITGAIGLAGLAGGAIPRGRVFPWLVTALLNTRRTVSTPFIQGPAILRKFNYTLDFNPDPPGVSVEVGWAVNTVTEAGVTVPTTKPYTNLFELVNPFNVGQLGAGQGLPAFSTVNTHVEYEMSLGFLILEPRFVCTISISNNVVGTCNGRGWLSVLEGIDPEALPAFTGS